MPRGFCGLCKQDKDLLNSHLTPAELYKFMREPSLENPNPVRLVPDIAVADSKQARRHFLCAMCETDFNNKGERCGRRSNEIASLTATGALLKGVVKGALCQGPRKIIESSLPRRGMCSANERPCRAWSTQ